ncbi:MAG: hypothetical protein KF832_18350 [Caldilineaceae bacterium]|nr:hypothetical protein [Caldilineaceae bacterium]
MQQIFTPHPIYRWLTGGCLLLTGLLAWGLLDVVTLEELFFLGISASLSLWFSLHMVSRVQLNERSLVLQSPWRGSRTVEFRQIVSTTEAGRFLRALSVIYHPREANGLLDLDRVQHLLLPAVVDQERLLTAIEAHIPS